MGPFLDDTILYDYSSTSKVQSYSIGRDYVLKQGCVLSVTFFKEVSIGYQSQQKVCHECRRSNQKSSMHFYSLRDASNTVWVAAL